MELRLYDTLTKEKRPFTPLDPQNVGMYVCGPTVYDFAHIGNARPVIVFDVLFRLLAACSTAPEHVTYVAQHHRRRRQDQQRVRHEILAEACRVNEAIRKLTDTDRAAVSQGYRSTRRRLEPTVEPRATEHIAEMNGGLCETLVAKGHAYVAEDHVLFDAAVDAGD